jgi:pimeloyl-ACP methyl ester carboxylesterase
MKHEVLISAPGCDVRVELRIAEHPAGMVVVVHGSGTDRHDARNRYVAASLVRAGFGALLVDLLDDWSTHERHDVFDVELQAARLIAVKEWLRAQPATRSLGIGYFATGVGTGVALMAAARSPQGVRAVVCRGGRPDTALHALSRLEAPTLFIAAANGTSGPWIRAAYRAAGGYRELIRIPQAGDAFGEAGAIEAVAEHACRWFARHLGAVESQVQKMEARFAQRHPGSACHATVEERAPHAYERRRYNVRLDVTAGGRRFVVNREHDDDPGVALREAFAAANRQAAALEATL